VTFLPHWLLAIYMRLLVKYLGAVPLTVALTLSHERMAREVPPEIAWLIAGGATARKPRCNALGMIAYCPRT